MVLAEPLAVARLVGDVLDELGVPWLVGGSVASSLHGIPRSTQDVDIVADMEGAQVGPFVGALQDRFYVDEDAVMAAVRRRSSCNLIHLDTMTKVDIFAMRRDALSRSEMDRRQLVEVGPGAHLPLACAEDIVLQKLDWFRKGGGVSERQWRDVLGVLRVCGPRLDMAYLRTVAAGEGLDRLLEEVIAEMSAPT